MADQIARDRPNPEPYGGQPAELPNPAPGPHDATASLHSAAIQVYRQDHGVLRLFPRVRSHRKISPMRTNVKVRPELQWLKAENSSLDSCRDKRDLAIDGAERAQIDRPAE